MGLFGASDLGIDKAASEFADILLGDEAVLAAFRTIRDSILLTDRRLLYVNVQGLTGAKTEYRSIPWRFVTGFALETAGTLDLDADMKIWVSGQGAPIETKISRRSDPRMIQRIIAERILGR